MDESLGHQANAPSARVARAPLGGRAALGQLLLLFALAVVASACSATPTLTITAPASDPEYTAASAFQFQAVVAPPNSSVTLNGAALTPDSAGNVSYVLSSLVEGPNNLTVVATDWLGENLTVTRVLVLDTVPPNLVVFSPVNDTLTNQTAIDVSGMTEVDATVTVGLLDAPVDPASGNFTLLNLLMDDLFDVTENVIVVIAKDRAGNIATERLTVWVDTKPPAINLDLDPAFLQYIDVNLWLYNNTVENHQPLNITTFSVRGTTDSADAAITVAGQLTPLTGFSFQRIMVLLEGLNVFAVRSEDSAGNSLELSFRITKDSIPPPLVLTWPASPFVLTNQSTLHIAGNVGTEPGLTVEVRYIDVRGIATVDRWVTVLNATTGLYEFWDGLVLLLNTDNNEHTVAVRSVDSAYNYNETAFDYRADVTWPFLDIAGFKTSISEPSLWINGTTEADVVAVEINGQRFPIFDQMFSVLWALPAVDGDYTIAVMVQDEAGNTNTYTSTTHLRIPPSLPATLGFAINGSELGSVNATDVMAGSEILFAINGTVAPGVEVRWLLDGQLVGNATAIHLNFTEGNHTLRLEVTNGRDTKATEIRVAARAVEAPPAEPRTGFLPALGTVGVAAALALAVIALRRRR